MRLQTTLFAAIACAFAGLFASARLGNVIACPFCSAVSQTLRQEMESMDVAAIGKIVAGSETDSDAEFEISHILYGESLIKVGQVVKINYFGKSPSGTNFLLMGVDAPNLIWSSPLPLTEKALKYVNEIPKLPKESLGRLQFYLNFLEDTDGMLARDAYDEFASAPYGELVALKKTLDHDKLVTWVKDTNLPPDRKRLYLVLLGICGEPNDTQMLEELLRSGDPNKRAGLDAMIACYVTLRGDEGLKLIDELFLANKQSQYADTYAAIMALRFHGTDGGVVGKPRLLESFHLILQRPELADLVIPDLARWEDWSQIDRLVELFKSADDKSSWVRVPVINYLRACPLPEASAKIHELKELDPAAFKRATSFFPVPKAPTKADSDEKSTNESTSSGKASVKESSSITPRRKYERRIYSDAVVTVEPGMELAVGDNLSPSFVIGRAEPNRAFVISVVGMVSLTIWIIMWLAISGAGRRTQFAPAHRMHEK